MSWTFFELSRALEYWARLVYNINLKNSSQTNLKPLNYKTSRAKHQAARQQLAVVPETTGAIFEIQGVKSSVNKHSSSQ